MFQDLKVHTGNHKQIIWEGILSLPFLFLFLLVSCGSKSHPQKVEGKYYLSKGQALQEVKIRYPDLAQFQQCSKPPSEICSWEDVFIFDDESNSMFYDLVFRDGNGRIEQIGLEKKVFLIAYYYYFTVNKDSGDVEKKGTFEKKLLSIDDDKATFVCDGKTFWGIPVTSDCSNFPQ